jgi:uncharacterized membrane protein YkvA (DUF1232 family)
MVARPKLEGTVMTTENNIEEQRSQDVYRRLRARLDDWLDSREGRSYRCASALLLLPDFVHLMVRLGLDNRVPVDLRTQTAAVLAYVILPLDLVPEAVAGPVGFGDDLLLGALIIRRLLVSVPRSLVLSHWAGPTALMATIQNVLDAAEEMVGARIWRRLRRMVEGGGE